MAGLVVLRCGGETVSVPGCRCDGTGTLLPYVLCSTTITPVQFVAEGWVLNYELLLWARCLQWVECNE